MRCARMSGMLGTALTAIVALAALPAGAETPSFASVAAAQAPGCVPVPRRSAGRYGCRCFAPSRRARRSTSPMCSSTIVTRRCPAHAAPSPSTRAARARP